MKQKVDFSGFQSHFPKNPDQAFIELEKCLEDDFVITLKFLFKRRIVSKPAFWKSEFVTTNGHELFSSVFSERLLRKYFGSKKHVNPSLNQFLAVHFPKLMIRAARAGKTFRFKEHVDSLGSVKGNSRELKNLYFEMRYLHEWHSKKTSEAEYFDAILKSTPYVTLFIHFISYWEKIKRSHPNSLGNQKWLISAEFIFRETLNLVINRKRDLGSDSEKNTLISIGEIRGKLNKELPPINPPEGIMKQVYLPVEEISAEKRLLRELIDFYGQYYRNWDIVNRYCTGQADFEFIDDKEAGFSVNDQYVKWRVDDKQSWYSEFYFMNHTAESEFVISKDWSKMNKVDRQVELGVRMFYESLSIRNISHEYTFHNNRKVNCLDIFKVLNYLSAYAMPEGRRIISTKEEDGTLSGVKAVLKREKLPLFENLFTPNYMVVFTRKKLIYNLMSIFSYNHKQAEDLVDFLSTDLSNPPKTEIDIFYNPLIMVGDKVFWLSAFMRDRKWSAILKSKITTESRIEDVKEINSDGTMANPSEEMEKGIEDLFTNAGFTGVLSSYGFNKGLPFLEGDIDGLAYKDGHLFIIELKTTHEVEDPFKLYINRYEIYEKAADQLDKVLDYFNENFSEFQKALGITEKQEDLKIHRFIVSNATEWDHEIIRPGIMKISLLELQIILTNSLEKLMVINGDWGSYVENGKPDELGINVPIQFYEAFNNSHSKNLNRDSNSEFDRKDFDLWEGKDGLTPERLLEIIKKNEVWGWIPGTWNFEMDKKGLWPFPSGKDFFE